MGRYTSVQAFGDNNPNMRAVPFDQAVGASTASASELNSTSAAAGPGADAPAADLGKQAGHVRTEKIHNPYGSVAGASSSDFHTYRAARSREMARLAGMDEDEEKRAGVQAWAERQVAREEECERKTERNRRRRKQLKANKDKKRKGAFEDRPEEEGEDPDDEFGDYVPQEEPEPEKKKGKKGAAEGGEGGAKVKNDGSFLAVMMAKKKQAKA